MPRDATSQHVDQELPGFQEQGIGAIYIGKKRVLEVPDVLNILGQSNLNVELTMMVYIFKIDIYQQAVAQAMRRKHSRFEAFMDGAIRPKESFLSSGEMQKIVEALEDLSYMAYFQ